MTKDSDIEISIEANSLEVDLAEFQNSTEWYMDSGCSIHVTGQKQLFEHVKPVEEKTVATAGGETHTILGQGNILFKTGNDEIKVTNVFYSPSIKQNLISVGSLIDTGKVVMFIASHVYILDNMFRGEVIALRERVNVMDCIHLVTASYQINK